MIMDVCVHSRHILWLGAGSAAQQVAKVSQLSRPRAVILDRESSTKQALNGKVIGKHHPASAPCHVGPLVVPGVPHNSTTDGVILHMQHTYMHKCKIHNVKHIYNIHFY